VPPLPHYGGRAPVPAPYEAPYEAPYDARYDEPRWDGDDDVQDYDDYGYDEQYGDHGDYDEPYQQPRTNTMAVLGLVFAFVFSPLGLVFSAIGLRQVERRWERGRGLAIAGLVVSILMLVIGTLVWLLVLPKIQQAAEEMAVQTIAEELSGATGTERSPVEGSSTDAVAGACDVIMGTLLAAESDMAALSTVEEYDAAIAGIRGTLESAAAGSADAALIADVQSLSSDFQQIAEVAAAGGDTTALENKATLDSGRVGARCAMAGWTE
jgi:hypothetical protein